MTICELLGQILRQNKVAITNTLFGLAAFAEYQAGRMSADEAVEIMAGTLLHAHENQVIAREALLDYTKPPSPVSSDDAVRQVS